MKKKGQSLRTIESVGGAADFELVGGGGFSRKSSLQVEQLKAFNQQLSHEKSLETSQFGSKLSLNLKLSSSANSFKLTPAPSLGATPHKRPLFRHFKTKVERLKKGLNNWPSEDTTPRSTSKISSVDPFLAYNHENFGTLSRFTIAGLSDRGGKGAKKPARPGVTMTYFPEKFDGRAKGKAKIVTVQRESDENGLGYELKGILSPERSSRKFLKMLHITEDIGEQENSDDSGIKGSLRKYHLSDLSLKNIHDVFAKIAPKRYPQHKPSSISEMRRTFRSFSPPALRSQDEKNMLLLYSKFKPEEEVEPLC